jgi:hypothetical protein
MAGLGLAIHAFLFNLTKKTWMPGTRPGMTNSITGPSYPKLKSQYLAGSFNCFAGRP